MNFLQLTLKQMRQRVLSSTLTILSVTLGVALAIAVMLFQRESEKLFAQSDFGYDLIIGAKGSKLQLVLNTAYHLDVSPGTIPWSVYEPLARSKHPYVRMALPYVVGDHWSGYRIVGTLPHLLPTDHEGKPIEGTHIFQYRLDKTFELAEGRNFHPEKFEAVVGAEVARKGGLKLGAKFKAQHGAGSDRGDEHDEQWTIVGVLKETKTANDRVIFIPLISAYAIPEHEKGLEEIAKFQAMAQGKPPTAAPTRPTTHSAIPDGDLLVDKPDKHDHEEAYHLRPDGTIALDLPKEEWRVSAILIRTRGGFQNQALTWQINNANDAMAVTPAMVMREFFDNFLKGSTLLLLGISALVTVVAAVSILVSIYNSVIARRKEIAILRALGATRLRVLMLICGEAAIIGAAGGLLGLTLGHLLGFGGSIFLERLVGQQINWIATSTFEWIYLELVILLSVLAGLVPALAAYRTPVATNLVAG